LRSVMGAPPLALAAEMPAIWELASLTPDPPMSVIVSGVP